MHTIFSTNQFTVKIGVAGTLVYSDGLGKSIRMGVDVWDAKTVYVGLLQKYHWDTPEFSDIQSADLLQIKNEVELALRHHWPNRPVEFPLARIWRCESNTVASSDGVSISLADCGKFRYEDHQMAVEVTPALVDGIIILRQSTLKVLHGPSGPFRSIVEQAGFYVNLQEGLHYLGVCRVRL